MDVFLTVLEWMALVLGILYVVGASFKKIWCWPLGILGSLMAGILAFDASYFQDMALNIYYIGMGIYGWVMWKKNREEGSEELAIITKSWRFHLLFLLGGLLLSAISGYFFDQLGNDKPFLDALTTIFAVLTTWMVARRILENWIYWILIDLLAMYMYWIKEMEALSLLFAFYTIWSAFGFYLWYTSWKKAAA
jgi:nicotinamide mononucleotide transporter